MKAHKTGPNARTYENFLTQYARRGDIDSALKMIEQRNAAGVALNESVASRLILCYLARGEYKEAEDIVALLEKRQIFYGKSIPHSFIIGAARRGDVEKLAQFIKLYSPGEQGTQFITNIYRIYFNFKVQCLLFTFQCVD